MAMRLGSSDDDDLAEMAEINVTPFIDVTLVLLIIFMVAAPLSTVDVPVNLPMSNAATQPRQPDPVFLTVDRDLGLRLGETPVSREGLGPALAAATGGDHERRIFLRADAGVPYGDLMGVMNLLRAAGSVKIALVGLEDPTGVRQPEAARAAAP